MNKKLFLLLSGAAVLVLATPVLAENLDDKLTPK
jgi:hypothetical protein